MRTINKRFILLPLIISILLSISSCGIKNQKAVTANDMDTSDIIVKMTNNRPDIVLTVGIYENGRSGYVVYGNNAEKLEKKTHDYAIGSVTEIFTGAYLAKKVSEGKVNIDDNIGKYIGISKYTPSIKKLVTHTSGLSDILRENKRSYNKQQLKDELLAQNPEDGDNEAHYSSFDSSLIGTALSEIEGKSYKTLMQDYIDNELKLKNTKVGGAGDLNNYLEWSDDNEIMASYSIVSNINDLLAFGKMHLLNKPEYLSKTHEKLASYDSDNDIGCFWLMDAENDVIWNESQNSVKDENDEASEHQVFIGYSPERDRVVAVMSNTVVNDDVFGSYAGLLGYSILLDE